MTVDTTIHLADIINTIVVPVVGYFVYRGYKKVVGFVDGVGAMGDVVDEHTEILTKAGWAKGRDLPAVGPAKRRHKWLS